ncbi:hypothetical protein NADFUDRAFT_43684 [Nadsonia fulvescens var. elongata DSM 6958]|uniref:HMG box domain-containing protein n=1 Tax=Nadsonia fulvescens var. elongata DSM 6958 TaxID=857566 RepID=A0A1E3PFB0_9ASCO|nr:hypothetical protein NADFUDRAFT_43684 [Nadsonia fulvescens var. elongata DSM 6958]
MKTPASSASKAQVVPAVLETEEMKYKQKCKELKRRIREIEDTNESAAINISRTKRAIKRLRLERAFILEKLEERTFLKVDDSDGTPSPPGSPIQHSLLKFCNGDLSIPDTLPGSTSADASSTTGLLSNIKERKGGKRDTEELGIATSQQPVATATARGKRNIPPRDPNMPKRPQNAYIIFCDLERDRVRAEMEKQQPGESFDLTKAMAETWREMNDNDKKLYQKLYEEDKLRYFKQMAAYSSPNLTTSEKKERARAEKALKELEDKRDELTAINTDIEENEHEDDHEHEREEENENENEHELEHEHESENLENKNIENKNIENKNIENKNLQHIKVELEPAGMPKDKGGKRESANSKEENTISTLELTNGKKISEPVPVEASVSQASDLVNERNSLLNSETKVNEKSITESKDPEPIGKSVSLTSQLPQNGSTPEPKLSAEKVTSVEAPVSPLSTVNSGISGVTVPASGVLAETIQTKSLGMNAAQDNISETEISGVKPLLNTSPNSES